MATFAAVGLVLGGVYALTVAPSYTANTNLLIDPNNRQIADQLSAATGVINDEPLVLSQVEILSSQKIALDVVDKLDLLNNAQFQADNKSTIGSLIKSVKSILNFRDWFTPADVAADKEFARQSAADALVKRLNADRVGRTYVLSIEYTSLSPELAAKVANEVAESYLADQLDSKFEATRRASEWLQQRIEELKQKSLETDMAVQKFKSTNNLISTGGQLISDQQLSQLNAQLILAQSSLASAKAEYDRAKSIIDSGQLDASVTEALNSTVINGLQDKYLDASRRAADISSRLGDDHLQAVRLRNEMQEYQRLMFEELNRIAASKSSSLQVAAAREKDLEEQVKEATRISATANDSQVQLRQLERESDTYKTLYGTFLQRYQEATQQQSFPITEARIISKATPPQKPSKPKKIIVFAIALFAGILTGAAAGGYREYRDRYFRTGDQIRQTLGVEYLGQVPLEADVLYEAEGPTGDASAQDNPRLTRPRRSILNYAIDHPLSSFAETLRAAKIACDVVCKTEGGKVLGIVSALPGEGKSTIAVNMAQLFAHQGSRVILIDGDLRATGATKALASHAERGLLEVLTSELPVREALLMDPRTRLAVLPAVAGRRAAYSAELLASDQMVKLLESLRQNFDYIVIDLPPMGAVVDARAVAPLLDCTILVSEWGKTPRSTVQRALEGNFAIRDLCAGVILNKVDMGRIGLYSEPDTNYYFSSRYKSYYREGL